MVYHSYLWSVEFRKLKHLIKSVPKDVDVRCIVNKFVLELESTIHGLGKMEKYKKSQSKLEYYSKDIVSNVTFNIILLNLSNNLISSPYLG